MDITARVRTFAAEARSLKDAGIDDCACDRKVQAVLAAPAPPAWQSTSVRRDDYLDIMQLIVGTAKDWVDTQGRVIDPVLGKEWGQTSPRFASPGAILLHFGRAPEVRDAVFRTMDYCCRTLPSGQARGNSPDFWMRELATAYMALETVASPGQLKGWAAGIAAVEPEKIYTQVSPDGTKLAQLGNWSLYAAGGEAMREAAGLKPAGQFLWGHAFYERYVGAQVGMFTANGMYRDPGDPITYDVTTRLQVACGLAFGYDGRHRAVLEELLRRGGLTTLLFALPEGFCPYGGRSAAFHFREAILVALCELEACRYRASNPRLAGAFRRQAHLSFLSVQRWLTGMQPWRHIKNGFAPATRHGIDAYGNYSVYSLLIASFLGLATVFADDTIPEGPCPAELGGFALELAPAFHKLFANCQDTYLEIDTAADPHYDATGLGCFAVTGVPLELGLGMPFPAPREKWGGPAIVIGPGCVQPPAPVALGPAWLSDGSWVSLAGLTAGLRSRVRILEESAAAVRCEVAYTHVSTCILETYLLERGKVTISARIDAHGKPVPRMRYIVPLLVTDGAARAEIRGPQHGTVSVHYLGHRYEIAFAAAVDARLEPAEYANRNGVYRSLVLETPAAEIRVALTLR